MQINNLIIHNTHTVKQLRQKIGESYMAKGYGRGRNKRPVYLIGGYCYAYHKEYANQDYDPCTGEMEGYVRVNYNTIYKDFYAVNKSEHEPIINRLTNNNV